MQTTQVAEKTCASCAFWKATDEEQGECRVRPPQAVVFRVDDETMVETCFPVTEASDWCGEFRAK